MLSYGLSRAATPIPSRRWTGRWQRAPPCRFRTRSCSASAAPGTRQPEAALLLHDAPGTLLTCDAIQHYGDYSHNNLMARLAMPFIGFPKTTVLGPVWLNMMAPEGASLRGEFDRLLEMDFDALIAAHGTWLPSGAKDGVRRAVDKAFGGGVGA